ncbi:MAG: iron ABC transporter permease [Anaerolineales bacterium]|nr:iron ABC transporter permease [Anaerolineales bacterium]
MTVRPTRSASAPASPARKPDDFPPRALTPNPSRSLALLAVCLVALIGAALLAVVIGSVAVPLDAVLALLGERLMGLGATAWPDKYRTILFDIRLPRIAFIAVTGAALASAGAAYQGLFRNPLADPYLVGVASGAGLGATLALTLQTPGTFLGLGLVPVGAFLGALATVGLVTLSAQVGRRVPISTMLLAGVAIGAFASALTTFLMLRTPEGLRRAFNWLLGGYTGGGWEAVLVILPYVGVGWVVLQLHARALNVLQLDEEQARQLGVNVERVKAAVVLAATLMTAAVVAFGGLTGFVGLVVPHALRLMGGPDYRRLLPLSALGGAAFLILADLVARTALAPQELPVGVVTALAGAPFFVFLLRRLKRSVF